MMRDAVIASLAIACLGACTTSQMAERATLERGHDLAAANCATCHAVARAGESPAPEAPAFRTLSRNYRVAALEEALAEGISVGHPAMPNFQFTANDTQALILYLQSIQEDRFATP